MGGARVKNLYEILEIGPEATEEEIGKARRRLLRVWHPDLNRGNLKAAKEKTIEILYAAEVLLDGEARAHYDRIYRNVFGAPPRETAAKSEPQAAHGLRIVICPSCHKKNVNPKRRYCIFCGEGIGENPRPFSYDDIAPEVRDHLKNDKFGDWFSRHEAFRFWPRESPSMGRNQTYLFVYIGVLMTAFQVVGSKSRDMTGLQFAVAMVILAILAIAGVIIHFVKTDANLK